MMLTMVPESSSPKGVNDIISGDPEFWETVRKACSKDESDAEEPKQTYDTRPAEKRADHSDNESEASEYTEDLESADGNSEEEEEVAAATRKDVLKEKEMVQASPLKSPKRSSRSRKFKDGPDFLWQKSPGAAKTSLDKNGESPRKAAAGPRRGKLTRTKSFDGEYSGLKSPDDKRLSWDRGSRPKPDFRWDKFMDLDATNSSEESCKKTYKDTGDIITSISSATESPKKPKSRRRLPRRTKSDVTGYDMPGRVRFCFRSTVCVEVPRATKDMKPDLYYTRKEIKEFKAERKEEKAEKREEKQKAKVVKKLKDQTGEDSTK